MKKWLKLAKFFITAPGWVKGPILTLILLLLVLGILLAPILGLLIIVLAAVGGVVAVIVWPVRSAADRFK